MLLNATSGDQNQRDVPAPSGPKASVVQVQSILFGSLASALLAAFLAMLGKQWLNLHVEGSLIDRSRHRELRMRGMIAWRFKLIMECLPLVMQLSLLLLGYALARYVWDLSRTVSAVITTFTAFGLLFYLFIVFAATVWKTCPFQTPISLGFRHILSLVKQHQHPRLREVRERLSGAVHFRKLNESYVTATFERSIDEELEVDSGALSDTLTPVSMTVNPGEDESSLSSDTNCISTMFQFASGSEAIVAVTGFIPEVNWATNIRRVPLLEVYHSLAQSFEFLKDGRVVVRPGMREQAYGSAKALLHLRVQRLCAGARDDARIATQELGLLLGYRSKVDHELESTLRVLDAVFNGDKEIPWEEFVFNDPHCCWLSHILRCRAWVILRTRDTLTKDILGFVRCLLSKERPPPHQAIADCLLITHMTIGELPEFDDRLLIKDKRLVPHSLFPTPMLTTAQCGSRGHYPKDLPKPQASSHIAVLPYQAETCRGGIGAHCGPEARGGMHREPRTLSYNGGHCGCRHMVLASYGVVVGRCFQVEWIPTIRRGPNGPSGFPPALPRGSKGRVSTGLPHRADYVCPGGSPCRRDQ